VKTTSKNKAGIVKDKISDKSTISDNSGDGKANINIPLIPLYRKRKYENYIILTLKRAKVDNSETDKTKDKIEV
jgi:hypothetical protein